MTDLTEGTEAARKALRDYAAHVDEVGWMAPVLDALDAIGPALHQAYEDGLVDGDRNAQDISENYDRNHALWAIKLTEAEATIERLRAALEGARGYLDTWADVNPQAGEWRDRIAAALNEGNPE